MFGRKNKSVQNNFSNSDNEIIFKELYSVISDDIFMCVSNYLI